MSTGVQARGGTSPTGSIATRGVRASSNYDRRTGVSSTTGDPFFSSVVLLAGNDNAANGATTFLDQSSSAKTITRVGVPAYSNAQVPTGMTTSINFPGGTDYLEIANNADFGYGVADFTIEFEARVASFASTVVLFDHRTNGTDVALSCYSSGTLNVDIGAGNVFSIASAMVINTWYHIAIAKASGTLRLFLNGVKQGSDAADASNYPSNRLRIGANQVASATMNGWISNFRVTKGVARYTAGFTAPTLPMPTS